MRAGFDATNILGHGGIKTYARELVRGLAAEFPKDYFHLFTTFSRHKKSRICSVFDGLPNVHVKRAVPHILMLGRDLIPFTRFLSGPLWARASAGTDIVHLTDPFGSSFIPRGSVSTVHDLFPLTREEYSGTRLESFYRTMVPRVLQRSRAVITPSRYVRDQLLDHFPKCRTPVFCVPEAASDHFRPAEGPGRDHPGYGLLPESYFLFVGGVDVRKNLPVILSAYGELPPDLRRQYPLVLVLSGDRTSSTRGSVSGMGPDGGIDRAGVPERTMILRNVPDDGLASLYRNAAALVFPSLDEGFGLPVLEAMSAGCPVITSNGSCIPEVAGNAALLVDPGRADELAGAMTDLAESPDLRLEYRERGLLRASLFSWSRTARETMAVYRRLTS